MTEPRAATCLCPDCDTLQRIASVPPGSAARCRTCGARLRMGATRPLDFALFTVSAALLLLAIGSTADLAIVERAGQRRTATLLSGPLTLGQSDLWPLGFLVGFVILVAPLVSSVLLWLTLVGVRLHWPRRWLAAAFTWRNRLRPWSMIEVFLVGYFVAYAKLGALVRMEPGPAFYALLAFMLATIAIDAVLDRQAVWEAIAPDVLPADQPRICCEVCALPNGAAGHCARCGSRLHRRKPDSVARTAALGAAALVLYLPANLFPVLTVQQLGRGLPSTILGGVWELIGAGEYPLALIVFLASVTVPMLKIGGLLVMIAVVLGAFPTHQQRKLTILYRVVLAIGRWSMIDIFMEAILASLVKFGRIATIQPGIGAISFAAVVVLTIFAAESFDPRLMWDRVRARNAVGSDA